jgi:adenosylhomocysteine nucleosidase
MKIAVIAAMPEEIKPLIDQLTFKKESFIERAIYLAKINHHSLFVFACGVGKVTAAVNTALLMKHHNVDVIINVGSAGGLSDQLAVGDVVIADRAAYYDVDLTAFGYQMGQLSKMPPYFEPDKNMLALIKNDRSLFTEKTKLGQIVSGDTFVNNNELKSKIMSNFPGVLALDMETASIAQCAFMFKKPFLAIRGISDASCSKSKGHHEENLEMASKNAADFCLRLIHKLGENL